MFIYKLLDSFQENGNSIAFIHIDKKYSYNDLYKLTFEYKLKLDSSNLIDSSIVALHTDFSPESIAIIFALIIKKCIIVPFSSNSVIESSNALDICGCDFIISFNILNKKINIFENKIYIENKLLDEFKIINNAGFILFSSGTSGTPKAILHNFEIIISRFTIQKKPFSVVTFLMIDHFGGLNTIFGILCSGGTAVTLEDRSVYKVCKAIEDYSVEILPTTPSFLTMLLASNLLNVFNFSSLKKITYGTEIMPNVTLTKLRNLLPNIIFQQTYGLSEVGVLQSKSKNDGSLWFKLGGNGFDLKIVDNILWIKSKFSMIGYINYPNSFDEDGYFNTQDIVENDGEYFKIIGRNSDIINVGGQKVYPAEIENILLEDENVLDVLVFAEIHPFIGNIVVAKLQLSFNEELKEIKSRLRKKCILKLSSYKIPVKFYTTIEPLIGARMKKIRH